MKINSVEHGKRDPKPSVLVSAYACEPHKGSEQGVGWNWALQLSRFANVTVITRANNEDVITSELKKLPGSSIDFVFYDPPKIIKKLKRTGPIGFYLFYICWQFGCYLVAKDLNARKHFSHVIHLTFGNIWLPIFVHRLPSEFILGPTGGGEGIPNSVLSSVGLKARTLQRFRKLLIATLAINPIVLGPLKRAKVILVRTNDTLAIIPKKFREKTACVLETGVDDKTFAQFDGQKTRSLGGPIRILNTGRLVGFKNNEMLLHAVKKASDMGADLELRLVGDGSEKNRLIALSKELGIDEIVTFVGSVPHSTVIEEIKVADIFAFPSLREAGTWSLVEAMCGSLPIVCVKTSGMAVLTTDDCSFAVDPVSKEHVISAFSTAIYQLSQNPKLRLEMGTNARNRVEKVFHWDKQGERVCQLILKTRNCAEPTTEI